MDYTEYTATELKAELDQRGIAYKGNASKDTLIELLTQNDAEIEEKLVVDVAPNGEFEVEEPQAGTTPEAIEETPVVETKKTSQDKSEEALKQEVSQKPEPAKTSPSGFPKKVKVTNATNSDISMIELRGILKANSQSVTVVCRNKEELDMLKMNADELNRLNKWTAPSCIIVEE